MSFLSKNIIPGYRGKTFTTDAHTSDELKSIKHRVFLVDGVKDVKLNPDAFPLEFTVRTDKMVSVDKIEEAAMQSGFHCTPKGIFSLNKH